MKVSAGESKEFELVEAGSFACRCIRVVDLGTQENTWNGEVKMQRQVCLTWELSELMKSGKPFIIQETYTASIGDRANLRKLLVAWRGRNFTESELKEFELSSIIGVPGLMSVIHKKKDNGENRARVGGILPLPKGMLAPDQVNDSFKFEIDEIDDEEKLKELWALERAIIIKSEEFKLSDIDMPAYEQKEDAAAKKVETEGKEIECPF